VLSRIYDAFVARLAESAKAWITGPAQDPAASIGPLIDRESVDRVNRYAEIGARDGKVVFRGALGPATARGTFVAPVIVADVPPSSPLAEEEVFGPVLAVMRASSLDEALALANGTAYALTGGLYSRSPAHIERARRDFDVGNLYINRKITGALVARQPFGGHRHSGTGMKAGGRDYLLQFVVARTITENTLRRGFAPD
jgi:RHH-type proline utilization regulon transcriptional repressor/proline dehydrogenase/delta 1-pyrroline-5-carboxylate dehydrogenase